MHLSSFFSRAAAAVALALSFGTSHAAPIAYTFSATIREAYVVDANSVFHTDAVLEADEGRGVGDIFTGIFFYDTLVVPAPLMELIPPPVGVFKSYGLNQGAVFSNLDKTVNYSSLASSWMGTDILVRNGTGTSMPGSWGFIAPPDDVSGGKTKSAYFSFSDFSGTAFADLSVPSNLELAAFNAASFSMDITRGNGDRLSLFGTITGLSAVAAIVPGLSDVGDSEVPEPAQLLLFALASIAAGVIGWRRMPR